MEISCIKMWWFIYILCISSWELAYAMRHDKPFEKSVNNPIPSQLLLKYDAPDDCQWSIREPLQSGIVPDEVALTCNLRTINSEFDKTNFSVIPSEHTTSLRILCSDLIISKSSLNDKSFAHLTKLRELILDYCKLATWPKGVLSGGLRDLRNLTVRTHNEDWPLLNLELDPGCFDNVRQLERLDLSYNSIWSFPDSLFCPLTNLIVLNVSRNRLQDISDLGFRQKPSTQQLLMSESMDNNNGAFVDPPNLIPSNCNLDLQILDVSFNNFINFPGHALSALKRLQELFMHNNEISKIADKALYGLKNLQILDLSNNRIVALPQEMFSETANSIKEIYLQNNSISVLAPNLFSNLDHLLALDLSSNQLTSTWINSSTFSGLIRLVLLNLSRNRISKVDPDIFKDLYTLQILNLEQNWIETIPVDTFAPMNNLHTLILSYNKITYLDAYSLNGLYVLSLLSLDNNLLTGIHADAFKNCSSLQELNLNGNGLTDIPLAIKNLHLLRTIDLGENSITSMEENSFKGLSNLYGLRLIGNQLGNITRNTFSELTSLQILNLARNQIQRIDKGTFEPLTKLQAIRLDSNLLTDIEGLFFDIPTLMWLNVSDNQIEWFDYALMPQKLHWLDLHKNNIRELGNHYQLDSKLEIQTLDVSYNKLTSINAHCIPNSIELLFLNDNQISHIEPQTFVKKTNLSRVDLYGNQIAVLELSALRLSPVDPERPLPEFYIGGNPFVCDCTMEWLQRINTLDHLRQHPRVMDLDSIFCTLLYDRHRPYIPLVEAELSQFLCPYKMHCYALCQCCDSPSCECFMTCPNNCTCYHDQTWAANIVECTNQHYSELPKIPMDATEVYLDGNTFGDLSHQSFRGRKNMKILYLNSSSIAFIQNHTFMGLKRLTTIHLEDNLLTQLHGEEFISLENLRELYLHNNRLNFINNQTFIELKHLEILRLDNNQLYYLPVWQFSLNSYLIELSLSNNQYSCDCNYLQKFRGWLQVNLNKVTDIEKLSCVFNNKSNNLGPLIADFNSTVCTTYTASTSFAENQTLQEYLPLLLVTIALFILVLLLVMLIFYYRREVTVWVFHKCGLRMCYKSAAFEDQHDKDRLFDAYICYSAKDEAFVGQVLASGLEAADPGYRLCLHNRDLAVSTFIAESIIEAVDSSRRTIIVLSKNFLNNEWCRFEFKSALHEVMKDRKRRLIFIVTGEIPQRDLDPDLRLYLKTNVVIDWNDRQFWHKLRFAMPDAKKFAGGGSTCTHHRHQKTPINIYASTTSMPPPPPQLNHSRSGGGCQLPLPPTPQSKYMTQPPLPPQPNNPNHFLRVQMPHTLWT